MHMTPVRTRQHARTHGLACLCVALLGGASARAAAAAGAEQLHAQGNTTACDVLVLGAGLAGTSAAWRLVGEEPRRHPGSRVPRVCVLEAFKEVGGRTRDHDIAGCGKPQTVELGAEWIAQQEIDTDVWDLALNELGLGIQNGWPWGLYGFPYGPGGTDPEVKAFLDTVPSASSSAYDAGRMFFGPDTGPHPQAGGACKAAVAQEYERIVMGNPWETPGAAAIDALTPLQWLASKGCNITKEDVVAQGLNQVNVSKPLSLPPAFYVSMTSAGSSGQEVFWLSSALWWLHNVKSNSGPISMTMDLQRYRIVGGPQQMARRLAAKIRAAGSLVEVNAAVALVAYDESGVSFTTKDGRVFNGKYAIVTGTPVALTKHVTWQPALPAGTQRMLSAARIGGYNKHYAFFNEGPGLWRDHPDVWKRIAAREVEWPMVYAALPPLAPDSQQMPNGTAFAGSGIIDNSPASIDTQDAGCPNGAGALFSFGWPANGSLAKERAQGWYRVLQDIPGLPSPSSVLGQAWSEEPYVMGAYAAWWPPGVMTAARGQFAALPGGRVTFAGSEWSETGAGYMNGAVHNGRKHATHVWKLLELGGAD